MVRAYKAGYEDFMKILGAIYGSGNSNKVFFGTLEEYGIGSYDD